MANIHLKTMHLIHFNTYAYYRTYARANIQIHFGQNACLGVMISSIHFYSFSKISEILR